MTLRRKCIGTVLCGLATAMLTAPVFAETICTHMPRVVEGVGVQAPTENQRIVKTRVYREYIELGDAAVAGNRLTEAVYQYARVFRPFIHERWNYTAERCASPSIYREITEKLSDVAGRLAAEELSRGHYLPGESRMEIKGQPGGALNLLLMSNDYDAFIEHSSDYAARILRERDIQGNLTSLVSHRLRELELAREHADFQRQSGRQDDTAPLLDVELAAFEKLKDFGARLEAHLAPLYPGITDHWLNEEAQRFRALGAQDSTLPQSILVDHAAGALEDGIDRLRRFPAEVDRLRTRGNERGEALMAQQRYALARAYFDAVGNENRGAQADALAKRDEQATVRALKDELQADIEKMQKTDEEKAAFDEDTEDMAAEFGFDLDE